MDSYLYWFEEGYIIVSNHRNDFLDLLCFDDMARLEEYREEISENIQSTLDESNVQPVLFVGSGMSIRYFNGPSWHELLEQLHELCPRTEHPYGYYKQNYNEKEIGEILAEEYSKWAWKGGRDDFDGWLYTTNHPDIFIKSKVSEVLSEITPSSTTELTDDKTSGDLTAEQATDEIELLKSIQPHAIITTNYDTFLESIYNEDYDEESGYNVAIGEQILHDQHRNIGEILKIHGCTTKPNSIILTKSDYHEFNNRQRYLSSKLLTYLIEHPVLIIGYSATDPNIQQIFSWVQQVLSEEEKVSNDIFYVTYDSDIEDRDQLPKEKQIQTTEGDNIKVNQIAAAEFDWVFEAFTQGQGLELPIGHARNIVGQTYELITSKHPDAEVVDYRRLEEIAQSEEELAKVLGIAVEEVPPIEFDHHMRPSELADELGFDHWTELNHLLDELSEIEGVDIRDFNNRYHIVFFDEDGGVEPRRYSSEAIDLLASFRDDEEYELGIPEERMP